MLRLGSVARSTMYLANMDIKTAFDEARPRHVAKIMKSHNTRRWIPSYVRWLVWKDRPCSSVCGEQVLIQ